jgi:hypothetical protein
MTSAAPALPVRIDEIDAQWLGDALRRTFDSPPPRVTRRDATLDGTATKVRVHLEGAGEAWPATVMVKGGFAAHRELMAPIYAKEVRAYRDILPRVAIETPRCWFAADDPARRQHLLVLEDLMLRACRSTVSPTCRASTRAGMPTAAKPSTGCTSGWSTPWRSRPR